MATRKLHADAFGRIFFYWRNNGNLQSKFTWNIPNWHGNCDELYSLKAAEKICDKCCSTYLQYDSPFGFDMHWPPFLHGDGAHDVNPAMKNLEKLVNLIEIYIFLSSGDLMDPLHDLYWGKGKKEREREEHGQRNNRLLKVCVQMIFVRCKCTGRCANAIGFMPLIY